MIQWRFVSILERVCQRFLLTDGQIVTRSQKICLEHIRVKCFLVYDFQIGRRKVEKICNLVVLFVDFLAFTQEHRLSGAYCALSHVLGLSGMEHGGDELALRLHLRSYQLLAQVAARFNVSETAYGWVEAATLKRHQICAQGCLGTGSIHVCFGFLG